MDHYQLRRVIDIYVQPTGEDLGRIASAIDELTAHTHDSRTASRVTLRGLVQGMRQSFQQLRDRAHALGGAAVPDSGGAVSIVPRSLADPDGGAARA